MSEDIRDKKLSRLYRESARVEPPAALDRAILEAARRAAEPGSGHRRPWWRRWAVPVTAFATLVLTVTLTLMVQHERERSEVGPESVPAEAAPAAPAPQPAAAPESAKADAAGAAAVPRQRPPAPPVPSKRMQDAGAPATQPFVREAKDAAPEAAEPLPQREIPEARPAAPPPAAPASADSAERRARTAPLLRKQEFPALAEPRPPEAWIEEIRQLRKQGRDKEAAEMLAELRKTYPDHSLPEDLR